jgi:hypothetical protein
VADGQVISVSASGFTSGASVAVIECQTGATSQSNCDLSSYRVVTASTTGTVSTPFIASRVLNLFPAHIDCAVAGACILAAANINNYSEAASTPLTFDPHAPVPPPLTMSGTLSPSGTVVPKTGVATLYGTVTCNRPAYVSINGELRQIYKRFIFSNYFFTQAICTGWNTWSVVVQPGNGLFGRGSASADLNLYGSVGGTFQQVQLSGITVTLSRSVNPPVTTVLIPSKGATLSGGQYLDASAWSVIGLAKVEFHLTGGTLNDAVVASAVPTIFGWLAGWNTKTVPNGVYSLQSVAYDAGGNVGRSAGVTITISN